MAVDPGSLVAHGIDPLVEEFADREPSGISNLPCLDATEHFSQSRLRLSPGAKAAHPIVPLVTGLVPARYST